MPTITVLDLIYGQIVNVPFASTDNLKLAQKVVGLISPVGDGRNP